jgi:hypothetical protein
MAPAANSRVSLGKNRALIGALLLFLARAYNLKASADYAIGDDVGVSLSEAGQAIEIAVHLSRAFRVC